MSTRGQGYRGQEKGTPGQARPLKPTSGRTAVSQINGLKIHLSTKKAGRERSTPTDARAYGRRPKYVAGAHPKREEMPHTHADVPGKRRKRTLTRLKPLSRPPTNDTSQNQSGTDPRRQRAGNDNTRHRGQTEHAGGSTPGSGKRRHRSETGTFEVKPGALQEHREDSERDTCTRQSGRACSTADWPPPAPVRGGGPGRPREPRQGQPGNVARTPRTTATSAGIDRVQTG